MLVWPSSSVLSYSTQPHRLATIRASSQRSSAITTSRYCQATLCSLNWSTLISRPDPPSPAALTTLITPTPGEEKEIEMRASAYEITAMLNRGGDCQRLSVQVEGWNVAPTVVPVLCGPDRDPRGATRAAPAPSTAH